MDNNIFKCMWNLYVSVRLFLYVVVIPEEGLLPKRYKSDVNISAWKCLQGAQLKGVNDVF